MTKETLSPEESALIFEALAAVAPDISFGPEAAPDIGFGPEVAPDIGFGPEVTPDVGIAPEVAPGIAVASEVQPYVFGQEGARPAERLMGLERMGEKLARAIRPAIEPIARARVAVSAEPPETRLFQDWQDEQPEFSALTFYRLRPLKGGVLIQVDAGFIASLVEIFYGGAPGTAVKRKPGDFTASEELLLNRLLEKVSSILAAHWNDVTPVELSFGGRETNIGHLPFLRGDEMVVVQKFALSAGVAPTTISVLYPLSMLRPIEEKLEARVHDDDMTASADWRWRLGQALEQVSLPVRSVLARPEISVAELLALKPGDVIPITLPPRTPLLAGARRIADGVIGEQDGRAALMIEKVGNA